MISQGATISDQAEETGAPYPTKMPAWTSAPEMPLSTALSRLPRAHPEQASPRHWGFGGLFDPKEAGFEDPI